VSLLNTLADKRGGKGAKKELQIGKIQGRKIKWTGRKEDFKKKGRRVRKWILATQH